MPLRTDLPQCRGYELDMFGLRRPDVDGSDLVDRRRAQMVQRAKGNPPICPKFLFYLLPLRSIYVSHLIH